MQKKSDVRYWGLKSVKSPTAGLKSSALEPPQTPPFTALFSILDFPPANWWLHHHRPCSFRCWKKRTTSPRRSLLLSFVFRGGVEKEEEKEEEEEGASVLFQCVSFLFLLVAVANQRHSLMEKASCSCLSIYPAAHLHPLQRHFH